MRFLFRERTFVVGSVASLVLATGTIVPFANQMQWVQCDIRWEFVAFAVLGLVLSVSQWFDRLARRIPTSELSMLAALDRSLLQTEHRSLSWIQYVGRTILLVTSALWLFAYSFVPVIGQPSVSPLAQLAALAVWLLGLCVLDVASEALWCGLWTWAVAAGGVWLWLFDAGHPLSQVAGWMGVATGCLSLITYGYLSYRKTEISLKRFAKLNNQDSFVQNDRVTALLLPLADVAMAHFASFIALYYVPGMLWATVGLDAGAAPAMWTWMLGLLFIAAIMFRGPLASVGCVLVAPVAAGIAVGQWMPSMFTYANLPLVYAVNVIGDVDPGFSRATEANKNLARTCSLWLYGLIALGFCVSRAADRSQFADGTRHHVLVDQKLFDDSRQEPVRSPGKRAGDPVTNAAVWLPRCHGQPALVSHGSCRRSLGYAGTNRCDPGV